MLVINALYIGLAGLIIKRQAIVPMDESLKPKFMKHLYVYTTSCISITKRYFSNKTSI